MPDIPNPVFADVQLILDAVLSNCEWGKSHPNKAPAPHRIFWRQTGDYDQDYQRFTTGPVPGVDIPIMNTAVGQELTSNFYVILINKDGLENEGVEQMPAGGPFVTDAGYQVTLADGRHMTGSEIDQTLAAWLTSRFPK